MTPWFGPAGRTGRLVVVRLAVLFLVAPLATCDQAAEAPDTAMSAPPPMVTVIGVQPTEVRPGSASTDA